jgi:ElaB/YqjD/DUF883 family membrane-anchored ribosome-binding protein
METTSTTMTGTPDVSNGVARTVDHATSSAHRAIDKATDAARPTVDKVATGAHNLVDKLAGVATTAADKLDTKSVQLKDAQARLTESCRDYVRENPLASLGIAVAAGFLLSRLLNSR